MKIKYLNSSSLAGQRVRVYRNLHCKNRRLYSVQLHYPGMGWRVAGHETVLFLKNALFVVSEAGRQRVIEQNRKNVHAYIYGDLLTTWDYRISLGEQVSYNPYKHHAFFLVSNGQTIRAAGHCSIDGEGILAYH